MKQAKTGKRKKWGSSTSPLRTPKTTQAKVVSLYLTGAKHREISRELGLDPETVPRILSQPEVELLVQSYRDIVVGKIVPHALVGAHELVKRMDGQMITNVLRGARVLIDRHEVATVQEPERTYDSAKVAFFEKYSRWPTHEEAIKFDKTIARKPTVKGSLTE